MLVANALVLPRGHASGVLLPRRLYLQSGIFIQLRVGIILVQLYDFRHWCSRAVSPTLVLPFFMQPTSLYSALLATVFSNSQPSYS
jgi:hypothetical protein